MHVKRALNALRQSQPPLGTFSGRLQLNMRASTIGSGILLFMKKSDRLQSALNAAQAGGEAIMELYGNIENVHLKDVAYDVGALVTDADRKSEEIITEFLAERFPYDSIYSEEGTEIVQNEKYLWAIDPLDGTSNFSRNIPLFGVSIGLIDRDADTSVLGVLHFPTLNITVYAEKGAGCYVVQNDTEKRANVSSRPLSESLYWSAGRFDGELHINTKLAENVGLLKIMDVSSYELAQIAIGEAEIYELNNVLHDVSAGVCIVQEAGGMVTDQDGLPWSPSSSRIVATNGRVHQEVLQLLK
jgi:myo-inositol-1(or 4)-monophosphatase